MQTKQSRYGLAVLTLLTLIALSLSATALWGQEGGGAEESRITARTWQLIVRFEREHNNVTGLAQEILTLAPEQHHDYLRL